MIGQHAFMMLSLCILCVFTIIRETQDNRMVERAAVMWP
jgi:hypothetical protein